MKRKNKKISWEKLYHSLKNNPIPPENLSKVAMYQINIFQMLSHEEELILKKKNNKKTKRQKRLEKEVHEVKYFLLLNLEPLVLSIHFYNN